MQKITSVLTSTVALSLFTATSVFAQTQNTPTLKIETPQEGQTVYGDTLPVLISTENFEIVDHTTNTINKPNQGHVHLWLDEAKPTPENATKADSEIYTFENVPYGDHTITAELVSNNHKSLTPKVTSTMKFKTEAAASPAPTISSNFDKNTAAIILIIVALVILAAWWYTKDEEDETESEELETSKKTKQTKTKKATKQKAKKSTATKRARR